MKTFEWDERKNEINIIKHMIDFNDAIEILYDDDRIEWSIQKNGEDRIIVIGEMNGIIITVIYTMRGSVYRIISARRARKNEKKQYQKRNGEI